MLKNILLVGANGFISKNLLDFHKKNSTNVNFILASKHVIDGIFNENYTSYEVSYEKNNELEEIFKNNHIDEVFHFASSYFPKNSNSNIIDNINTDLIGTINLLNLMVKFNVSKITYLSSGGSIGDSVSSNLLNSYAIIKNTSENYLKLYFHLYKINYLIIRPSNVFGIFHKNLNNGFINIVIKNSVRNLTTEIWGDGKISKDYVFAQDLISIIWKLNLLEIWNETIYIGSGIPQTQIDILNIFKEMNVDIKYKFVNQKNFDMQISHNYQNSFLNYFDHTFTPLVQAIELTYNWELNTFYETH